MSRWPTGTIATYIAVFVLTTVIVTQAQPPSLTSVLARAATYVTDFRRELSGIVAEESYEQRARFISSAGVRGFEFDEGRRRRRRTLRSDFLLVRPEGQDRYHEFRDVFEVDGRPVRDREERLTRLFLDNTTSSARQIEGIVRDSARYNIGDIHRTLNTPTLALLVLHPDYQHRFRFAHVADSSLQLPISSEHLPDQADVWVIEYEEVLPNTLVRGDNQKDLPSEGRFWIEPGTGRVLLSELVINDPKVSAIVDVGYGLDLAIGHLVPIEMRERYRNRRDGSRVEGKATYGRFRRFQVQVEETGPFRN